MRLRHNEAMTGIWLVMIMVVEWREGEGNDWFLGETEKLWWCGGAVVVTNTVTAPVPVIHSYLLRAPSLISCHPVVSSK